MKFNVLTLFPEMFEPIKRSIIGKAVEKNIVEINLINMRDFSKDKHKKVDDTPYGDIVYDAYKSIEDSKTRVIYLSPQGKTLNQKMVEELSEQESLTLLCGHYEGIDQRVLDKIVDEEISIGDYVLTGGEIPAMVLIDSVSRYINGVLNTESIKDESFCNGLLEYPQYTKPELFENMKVPEVLLSGHHKNIEKWRRNKSLELTYKNRPELLKEEYLTKEDKEYLEKLKKEDNDGYIKVN